MRNFLIISLLALFLCSCGGTTVKVRQSSDGVNAEVSVTTNNPTSVQVTPSVNVKLDDLLPVVDTLSQVLGEPLSFNSDGELNFNFSDLCLSKKVQTLQTLSMNPTLSPYIMSLYSSGLHQSHVPTASMNMMTPVTLFD